MNKLIYLIIFLGLILVGWHLFAQSDQENYMNLDPEEFYFEMLKHDNEILIDVRLYSDYRKNRLKNAISAERKEILASIADTLDTETPVFIYCNCSYRSTSASEVMTNRGFEQVYNLKGGIIDWISRGYELEEMKIRKSGENK